MVIKNAILLFIVLLLLFVVTIIYMESFLFVDDELSSADAVVVLMGSNPRRMPEAADIFRAGYTDILLIVQGISSETAEGVRDAIALGIPVDNIIVVSGQAKSTWDEAAVRDYLAEGDLRSTH